MIVKNEYVRIKTNKKEYTLKNYIYDNYLQLFSEIQTQTLSNTETRAYMSYCYLKFDTVLEDYHNASINDFDVRIQIKNDNISGNEKKVNIIYDYSSNKGIYSVDTDETIDLSVYDGSRITAIGFGGIKNSIRTLYACLDTSNYSIIINGSGEINVSRKDVLSTNAVCDGYEYPYHLAPVYNYKKIESGRIYYVLVKPILYSVGFGEIRGKMNEEFIIGEDANIDRINNFKYSIIMNNPIAPSMYPGVDIEPTNNLYPIQPEYKNTIHPQENRYTSNTMYPLKSGYNYIIFKYRLYYFDGFYNDIVWLDEYYTMSYFCNPKGIFKIINRIERGE